LFRGISTLSLDAKGRIAIPSRYRERLSQLCASQLVLTLSPFDRCLSLYPLNEWEGIETKLLQLSDFDRQSRRTKQMMRGYATECEPDGHGRILLSQQLREFAGLAQNVAFLGAGNKFEIWDEATWTRQRTEWLAGIEQQADVSAALRDLSL
jgi:MraZ protein